MPHLGDDPIHTAACHFPVADGENLAKARPALSEKDRIVEPEAVSADVVAELGGLGERGVL
jgi:hypothetical protein